MRILVVDDQRMVAEGLARALAFQPEVDEAMAAASVAEATDVVARRAPSVVVIDWRLPDAEGPDAVRTICRAAPGCRVLVMADLADATCVRSALAAGCDGFVTRDRGLDELLRAVGIVARGESALSPAAASALVHHLDRPDPPPLSERELEVVGCLARGLTNRAIAEELYLSVHTVRNHIQRICRRLGARSRLEVVVIAARRGLVELAPGA